MGCENPQYMRVCVQKLPMLTYGGFDLSGNPAHAENLRVVLLSRDPTNLRSELSSNKKVKVVIDGQGEYELEAGKHFHFSVGDHLLQASSRS
jgi:hypothetical protein